jgi:hypothetical protein
MAKARHPTRAEIGSLLGKLNHEAHLLATITNLPQPLPDFDTDPDTFFSYVGQHPVVLEFGMSDPDPKVVDCSLAALRHYLFHLGTRLNEPLLEVLGTWLCPNADSNWRLKLFRRGRGNRRINDRAQFNDAQIRLEVEEIIAALKASGQRSPAKRAKDEVAARHGKSIKFVEAALTRSAKILSK